MPGEGSYADARVAQEFRTFREDHAGEWPPATFRPSDAGGWARHKAIQSARTSSYFAWLNQLWPDLNLTQKQMDAVKEFFLSCPGYEMKTVEQAAHSILDNLDVTSSFDYAGSKLVGNLAVKCEALVVEFDRRTRNELLNQKYNNALKEKNRQKWAVLEEERASVEYSGDGHLELERSAPLVPSPENDAGWERQRLAEQLSEVSPSSPERQDLQQRLDALRQSAAVARFGPMTIVHFGEQYESRVSPQEIDLVASAGMAA